MWHLDRCLAPHRSKIEKSRTASCFPAFPSTFWRVHQSEVKCSFQRQISGRRLFSFTETFGTVLNLHGDVLFPSWRSWWASTVSPVFFCFVFFFTMNNVNEPDEKFFPGWHLFWTRHCLKFFPWVLISSGLVFVFERRMLISGPLLWITILKIIC